jgi:hypothetical protein
MLRSNSKRRRLHILTEPIPARPSTWLGLQCLYDPQAIVSRQVQIQHNDARFWVADPRPVIGDKTKPLPQEQDYRWRMGIHGR